MAQVGIEPTISELLPRTFYQPSNRAIRLIYQFEGAFPLLILNKINKVAIRRIGIILDFSYILLTLDVGTGCLLIYKA